MRDLFFNIRKMLDKKPNTYKSPDLSKLKEVIIDYRTRIYIALDADAQLAKEKYLIRVQNKKQ
jgi:hypothetical protein